MNWRRIIVPVLLVLATASLRAQNIAIKSNLLYDATGTINLGFEGRIADKWTAELTGNLNPWMMKDQAHWKHAYLQPEIRWWFCDTFSGHFLALHLHGGIFNVGNLNNDIWLPGCDLSPLMDSRFQGWFAGAGIGYGYDLILSRHWNLEFEIGAGYAYSLSDQFECGVCGSTIAEDITHHYFGITKAAVSLVYLF